MQRRLVVLIFFCLLVIACVFGLLPPMAQNLGYHQFADQRTLYGIANFNDTFSSLALLATGILGLCALARLPKVMTIVITKATWWPAVYCLFIAVILSGLGSAYYHLLPGNARMVADRISITLVMMSLLASFIADRIQPRLGIGIYLPLLLLTGAASAIYWWLTETAQQGDLRAYGLAQYLPILVMVYLCAVYSPGTWLSGRKLGLMIVLYGLAKLCESNDLLIYIVGNNTLSGHSLKHYFAALATLVPVWHLLQLRRYPYHYLARS